jgi:hypothetical protein
MSDKVMNSFIRVVSRRRAAGTEFQNTLLKNKPRADLQRARIEGLCGLAEIDQ